MSIAIVGRAAITPLGDTPRAILDAVAEGKRAREIAGFDASKYATVRGMRMYNRATQLAICAAKLAVADASLEVASDDLGVVMASTYGHLDVLVDYDGSLVKSGMARTNASLMPFSIQSAPGAMTALALGAKAFSLTIASGAGSALDALALAARWIDEGRGQAAVVVAAFAASPSLRPHVPEDVGEGAVAFVLAANAPRSLGFVGAHAAAHGKDAVARARHDVLVSGPVDLEISGRDLTTALGHGFDLDGALRVLVALDLQKDALILAESESGSASALVVRSAA